MFSYRQVWLASGRSYLHACSTTVQSQPTSLLPETASANREETKITIELHLAAVVVFLLVMDLGTQVTGVSTAAKLATIDALARARLNSVNMLANLGGAAVGNQVSSIVLLRHDTSATGAMWMGMLGVAILICLSRGPHASRKRWCGWEGGARLRRAPLELEETKPYTIPPEVCVVPVGDPPTNTELEAGSYGHNRQKDGEKAVDFVKQ